jgi:hypothetical protein
VGEMDRTTII